MGRQWGLWLQIVNSSFGAVALGAPLTGIIDCLAALATLNVLLCRLGPPIKNAHAMCHALAKKYNGWYSVQASKHSN